MLTAKYFVRQIYTFFQVIQGFVLFVKFKRYICISKGNVSIFVYAICCSKDIVVTYFKVMRTTGLLISRHLINCSHDTDRAFFNFHVTHNFSLSLI